MRNILITLIIYLVPSLAMAQGQITRKPVTPTPTHKHSVSGPNNCKECNRLRKEKQRIEEQRRKEKERLAEQQRLAEEKKRKEEERRRAEEQRKEEERKRIEAEDRLNAAINGILTRMVYVNGGTFTMGATSEQGNDWFADEKPAHRVTLPPYYIGKYEVTQAEWKAIMGSNPSYLKGDNLPVSNVSWYDCQEFINKLNTLTGKNFRLPTEAEWEFAARGGNNSLDFKYSGSDDINSVAWYSGNCDGKIHHVGQKKPNELGLYDMSGNVWEWCQDWYGGYSSSSQTNPTGYSTGSERIIRGGDCINDERRCRVSFRFRREPAFSTDDLGLRLAKGFIPQTNETKIYGTVVDENNEPLIGATIRLLNTDMGSFADLDGIFLITTSIQDPMIEISYVGYETKIIKGTSNMKIRMTPK